MWCNWGIFGNSHATRLTFNSTKFLSKWQDRRSTASRYGYGPVSFYDYRYPGINLDSVFGCSQPRRCGCSSGQPFPLCFFKSPAVSKHKPAGRLWGAESGTARRVQGHILYLACLPWRASGFRPCYLWTSVMMNLWRCADRNIWPPASGQRLPLHLTELLRLSTGCFVLPRAVSIGRLDRGAHSSSSQPPRRVISRRSPSGGGQIEGHLGYINGREGDWSSASEGIWGDGSDLLTLWGHKGLRVNGVFFLCWTLFHLLCTRWRIKSLWRVTHD